MINGITHVTRHVPNVEEALAFYRDLLGFTVRADGEVGPGMRWLTVGEPGGTGPELVLFDPNVWLQGDERDHALASLPHQPQLIVSTPDVDGLLARLRDAGVALDTPEVRDLPWGRDIAFRDPSGSSVNAVQPKPEFAMASTA